MSDGAMETENYRAPPTANYTCSNKAEMEPFKRGLGGALEHESAWQRLKLGTFIDKNKRHIDGYPPFTTPHWRNVLTFALERPENFDERPLLVDPGEPPVWGPNGGSVTYHEFVRNHAEVALLSGHLDQHDGVAIDVGPRCSHILLNTSVEWSGVGQVKVLDASAGACDRGESRENPYTGEPYRANIASRGDYTRMLVEFWADGLLGRQTPGAHWFFIYNWLSAHPLFERRLLGGGAELDALEFDVKAYLALGAAAHDSGVAAWAVKRFYDTARPISAIRFMASLGQSSDETAANYNAGGLPLVTRGITAGHVDAADQGGGIELVTKASLSARGGGDKVNMHTASYCNVNVSREQCIDEVSVYFWHPLFDVGWYPGDLYWPYMRSSFITPSFPGYVSGHSTFARASADILRALTGSDFFPGGMMRAAYDRHFNESYSPGTPAEAVELQWATYSDAADACGLSRVYGGVHPPFDNAGGHFVGAGVATQVWKRLLEHFGALDQTASRFTFLVAAADARVGAETLRRWCVAILATAIDSDRVPEMNAPIKDNDVRVVRRHVDDSDGFVRMRVFAYANPGASSRIASVLASDSRIGRIIRLEDTDLAVSSSRALAYEDDALASEEPGRRLWFVGFLQPLMAIGCFGTMVFAIVTRNRHRHVRSGSRDITDVSLIDEVSVENVETRTIKGGVVNSTRAALRCVDSSVRD